MYFYVLFLQYLLAPFSYVLYLQYTCAYFTVTYNRIKGQWHELFHEPTSSGPNKDTLERFGFLASFSELFNKIENSLHQGFVTPRLATQRVFLLGNTEEK